MPQAVNRPMRKFAGYVNRSYPEFGVMTRTVFGMAIFLVKSPGLAFFVLSVMLDI